MSDHRTLYFGLIVALVVFLTACTAEPSAPLPVSTVVGEVALPATSLTPVSVQDTPEAAFPEGKPTGVGGTPLPDLAIATPPVATGANPEPAASLPTPTRTIRSELAATDPETVQLASGRPQLVEFFAFW